MVTSNSSVALRSASDVVVLRLLCSTTAAASTRPFRGYRTGSTASRDLPGPFAVFALKTVNWSSSVCVATPLREVTSFMADTKSGHAGDQRALQRVEIVVGAGQHFLQQDVAFAQALEQRDRIGTQDLAGLLHFGHGRDRYLARLIDGRPRGLLEVLQRFGNRAGREVAGGGDVAGHLGAMGRHRLREGHASRFDRLQRVGGGAIHFGRRAAWSWRRAPRPASRAGYRPSATADRPVCCT